MTHGKGETYTLTKDCRWGGISLCRRVTRFFFFVYLLFCQTPANGQVSSITDNSFFYSWSAATPVPSVITSTTTGGLWSAASTWVGGVPPAAGDEVIIANGATVTVDINTPVLSKLTIGQGTSGILQYDATTARTLTVSGDITIATGGTFNSASLSSSSTITTHSLVVGGSLINNGTLNFSATTLSGTNASGALITFNGATDANFDCSGASFTNLRSASGVVLNKGSSNTTLLNFIPGGNFQVESLTTKGFLTITNGTFKINGTNTFTSPVFTAVGYSIPSSGGFWLNNANATIVGQNGSVTNNGLIRITSGTYNVGNATGNELHTATGGLIDIQGGIVNITGRLRNSAGSASITGGVITLSTISYSNATDASFDMSLSTNLTISGSPLIIFQIPNAGAGGDIVILNSTGTKTITGGTFQAGNASTPANSSFLINSAIPLYNLSIFSNSSKLGLSTTDLTINNQLTLNGQLLLNNQNLILGATAPAINGILGAANGMIVLNNGVTGGEVRKIFTANGSYTFPVGDITGTTEYSPISLTFTSGTYAPGAYAAVKVINAKHPGNTNTTSYLNRYWSITTSGITSPSYNLAATNVAADVVGTEAGVGSGIYSGSSWTKYGAVNTGTKTISATGITTAGVIGMTGVTLANPICNISGTNTICSGQTTVFTADLVTGATYSWLGPGGFSINGQNTGNISVGGTYTVTVTDGGGSSTCSRDLTVNPLNTVGTASSSPALCISTALTSITHTTTGATGIGTPTGLPGGVTAAFAGNTITISGTPTAAGTFNYSIPLTGGCGTVNATGTITVNPLNTVGAASSSPALCISTALTSITHTTTGATGIGTPTGLPGGVTAAFAGNTITISGTPTAAGTFNYSIPLTGGCGTVNATGTITVNPLNTVGAASSSPALCISTALTSITHTTTGATGIGTPTGLPGGVTAAFAGNTITISGTPTAAGTFNYSIPLTGGCGTVNATGTITVNPLNTVGAASSSPALCISTALTSITHTTTGATGIGTPTGLPGGVTAAFAGNTITISGTPTAAGTFNYSIPLTGGCGTVNATGTITVNPLNTVGAASSSPALCISTALTSITHTTTGATGIGTPTGLPGGVTAAFAGNTITISGTPTAAGTFNYSIPLTGGCGTVNATGTITVNPLNTVGAASSSP